MAYTAIVYTLIGLVSPTRIEVYTMPIIDIDHSHYIKATDQSYGVYITPHHVTSY